MGSQAEPEPSNDRAPAEVSVLSYNTHGLPAWIALDRPGARLPVIGRLTNRYDVALLQEDFAYHDRLLLGATHPVVERGNPQRPGTLGEFTLLCGDCGSGLTTLKRFSRRNVIDVYREAFDACSGWVLFWTGSDCWATKGLLSTRIQLANGAEIDFFNVHLDAGITARDQRIRVRQLGVLRDRIVERAGGRALIVGGDFNLRSDNPDHTEILADFGESLELTEIAVELADPPWNRRVDYIFFRSGDETVLELVDSGVAREFVHRGAPLSDHPALFARFRVQ